MCIAIGAIMCASLSLAVPAGAEDAAGPPILGAWAVDVSQLPIPEESRPESVTMTFSDAGEGRYRTNVDIVAAGGSESHGHSTYLPDATPAAVVDSPEADLGAVRMPAPGVLVMALSRGGVPGSIRIYTVAPGNQTMTETAVYYRPDGTPVMRTNHFTRLR